MTQHNHDHKRKHLRDTPQATSKLIHQENRIHTKILNMQKCSMYGLGGTEPETHTHAGTEANGMSPAVAPFVGDVSVSVKLLPRGNALQVLIKSVPVLCRTCTLQRHSSVGMRHEGFQ